jgi:L-lactate dehydrogenase complex protein LldG
MEEKEFLANIGARLGRPMPSEIRARLDRGVPEFHKEPAAAPEAMALQFKAELEKVGGLVYIEAGRAAARARAEALLAEWAPQNALSWARSEFAAFDLDWLFALPGVKAWEDGLATGQDYKRLAMAADLGITGADFAVAQTGTLVLLAGPGRPRAMSLCPSAHLAFVSAESLVADMGEAFHKTTSVPSNMAFITGPSRTSDIENDSTIGVHGPASVTVILQL